MLVAALCGGGAGAAPQEDAAELFLRASVQVRAPALTLGDVARIDAPADRRDRLARLRIGAVPASGEAREITRDELERWIATADEDLGVVAWKGNASVRVARKTVALDRDAVLRCATEAARAALRPRFRDLVIEAAGSPLPDLVAAGAVELRARPLDPQVEVTQRLVVWVELWQGGRLYRAIPVALRIQAMAPVLRLNASIPAGASVSMTDMSVEERDVAALSGAYWPAHEPLGAVRARQPLAAGAVLMRSQLQALPDVERGDQVALRVRAGSVTIETSARALQDGWTDRTLRVMPANASEAVVARVVRGGLVEVSQ
jgi:flagella basal body P-ring formation protein FlgA